LAPAHERQEAESSRQNAQALESVWVLFLHY